MLELKLPIDEVWNPNTETFMSPGDLGTFHFEHSLLALSNWEAKWKVPFLTKDPKDSEQLIDYFYMMCKEDIPKEYITVSVQNSLMTYINEDWSATRIKSRESGNYKIVTTEVLYAYMCEAGIPFQAETWNLSRLLKLIEVIGSIRNPGKKMSKQEIFEQNRRLNEERRRKYNTKG